jgi:hypothetical protein
LHSEDFSGWAPYVVKRRLPPAFEGTEEYMLHDSVERLLIEKMEHDGVAFGLPPLPVSLQEDPSYDLPDYKQEVSEIVLENYLRHERMKALAKLKTIWRRKEWTQSYRTLGKKILIYCRLNLTDLLSQCAEGPRVREIVDIDNNRGAG